MFSLTDLQRCQEPRRVAPNATPRDGTQPLSRTARYPRRQGAHAAGWSLPDLPLNRKVGTKVGMEAVGDGNRMMNWLYRPDLSSQVA